MRLHKPASVVNAKLLLHWVLLCIVIPILSIAGNTTQHAGIVLVFPSIVIIYCGTRLAVIAAMGSNSIVEITFWLYTYIFMGICAFLQIEAGRFPWYDHYSDELIISAQLLVIGGMVAFDLGRRVCVVRTKHIVTASESSFELSANRLYFVAVICMGMAVYATQKLGGFSTLFLNRAERYVVLASQFNIAEMSIYNSLAKTTVYVLFVAALAYKLYGQRKGVTINLLITVLAAFVLIENNPIATARFQVGTILLGVVFIFPWKKYKAMLAIYGLVVGLAIVFPYADSFRASSDASFESIIERFGNENPLAVKVDYDSFQQVMNGVRMADEYGLEYGRQVVGALLFWVPRSIWPNKAEPTGALIAERSGYDYTNLSAPLWVEFYVDGGIVLLLIGFMLYGAFVRWADSVRWKHTGGATPAYLFVTIFAGYQIYLLRGSLMPSIAYLSPIVPILLVCGKFRKFSAPY